MSNANRIDVHQHTVPPFWADELPSHGGDHSGTVIPRWSPQSAVEMMDAQQITTGILSLTDSVAAISCGLYNGNAVLDLDYTEDSNAQADANFVLTGSGGIIEIQGTAEHAPFSEAQFNELLALARAGIAKLTVLQKSALA